MISEDEKTLIRYRIAQAEQALRSAANLMASGDFHASVNRSYYAMFYCVVGLLALQGKGTSKHGSAISLFDLDFIKSGAFDKRFSKWLHEAFHERLEADYEPFAQVSPENASSTLEHAREFVEQAKEYLSANIGAFNPD